MPAPYHAPGNARQPRSADIRRRNARIASVARAYRFGNDIPVPFLCECDDDRCTDLLRLTLPQWDDARIAGNYVVAPAHEIADARLVRIRDGHWLYRGA